MVLEPHDVKLFFKLQWALLFFVNQRLKVVPDPITSPTSFAGMPPKVVFAVRDALNANLDLIESFVSEHPARLAAKRVGVNSGQLFLRGHFPEWHRPDKKSHWRFSGCLNRRGGVKYKK